VVYALIHKYGIPDLDFEGLAASSIQVRPAITGRQRQQTASMKRTGNYPCRKQDDGANERVPNHREPPTNVDCSSCVGSALARAIAAQLVPAAEIHWSFPCGKPLSLYR